MNKQIIAALDGEGRLAAFTQAQCLVLWRKTEAQWRPDSGCDVAERPESAETIKNMVDDLAEKFADCHIIVAQKVSGLAYQLLNKKGYAIFEAEEISGELLDGIMQDILQAQAVPDLPPREPVSPQNDGNFYFDLVRLQKAFPEISSKMALQNFIRNVNFMSLELICDHLPPWMEQAMADRSLEYCARRDEAGVNRIFITRRMCR
ncbi:MAG TPA: Fe-only nitrogenase accessory AnfO family protein [Syntrophomonas sp.]|nr:Fe-only nitrogenase accessory AnfO family protein [Syntrophomonas sp.]